MFIRARALALWQEQQEGSASDIAGMIEGVVSLDELDLIGQTRLSRQTHQLLAYFLQPKWFQTAAVLGHAKLFFSDFAPAQARDVSVVEDLKFTDARLREYCCYLLLDFVTVDPELEDMPLAAALELSRELDMDVQFEKLAAKELKMKVRDVRKLKDRAAEMLVKAGVAA